MRLSFDIDNIITELAVVVTVLSFSPNNAIANICEMIMYALWGFVIILKICQQNFRVDNFAKGLIVFYLFWYALTQILYALEIYPSAGLGVVSYLPFCIIFYVVGMNYRLEKDDAVKRLVRAFVIGQIFLLVTLLPQLDAIQSDFYQYSAKNQMGQMLGIAVVFELLILNESYNNIFKKVFLWICSGFSLIALLIIRSRTPLIGLIVVLVAQFIWKKNKKALDYLYAACVVIVCAIAIIQLGGIPYLMDLFEIGTGASMNDLTSGRGDHFGIALREFWRNPIVGIGGYAYVDNFVLNVLRCGGLLLGMVLIPAVYMKLFSNVSMARQKISLYDTRSDYGLVFRTLLCMSIFYFIISLMEGYPPLGPNTSVFFLWVIMGIGNKIKRDEAVVV